VHVSTSTGIQLADDQSALLPVIANTPSKVMVTVQA